MTAIKKTKKELLASSENHRLQIKQELGTITTSTTNIAKKAAIGGGVAVIGLGLLKLLTSGSDRKNKSNPLKKSGLERVGLVLGQQAMLYILNEGRAKIVEYIKAIEDDEK